MGIADEIAKGAEDIEHAVYPPGNGNGKRTRRVVVIAVLLTAYFLLQWVQSERNISATNAIAKELVTLTAKQDTLSAKVGFSIDWIKYHQSWSERVVRDSNRDRERVWKALNRPDDYRPLDER